LHVFWHVVPADGPPSSREIATHSSVTGEKVHIDVSRDGRYVFLADEEGDCEIRDMKSPTLPHRYYFLASKISAWALGNDGKTLAIGSRDGSVALMQLPGPPESMADVAASGLQQLLSAKDYDSLERVFAAFERDFRPFRWQPSNSPYATLASLLFWNRNVPGALQLSVEAGLQRWIADRPDATAPKLMLASHYISMAWSIRGGGVAARVTPERWKGFYEYIDKAEKIIMPIAEGAKPPPFVWPQLFRVATAQSWEKEKWEPHAKKLLEQAPLCFDAHAALLMRLMPRWGGGPDDVEAYAARVADVIGGAEGDAMYARLAYSQRPLMSSWEQFDEVGFYRPRIMNGFEHLAKTASDRVHWANVGVYFASATGDEESAARVFKLLPAEHNPRTLWDMRLWQNQDRVHPLFLGKPAPASPMQNPMGAN
jgi:hypothetical protein